MDTFTQLQHWYEAQCNDIWEHTYGVKIDTLDNPGWCVTIDLTDTALENIPFADFAYGVGNEGEERDHHWLTCTVEDKKFKGYGGPLKLKEIVDVFLSWAKTQA